MSSFLQFILPAVSGAGGASGIGAFVLRFIKNQAEDVVNDAIQPIAADLTEVKNDVAYIKGKVGIPQ